jgi:hypothetical protein
MGVDEGFTVGVDVGFGVGVEVGATVGALVGSDVEAGVEVGVGVDVGVGVGVGVFVGVGVGVLVALGVEVGVGVDVGVGVGTWIVTVPLVVPVKAFWPAPTAATAQTESKAKSYVPADAPLLTLPVTTNISTWSPVMHLVLSRVKILQVILPFVASTDALATSLLKLAAPEPLAIVVKLKTDGL